MFFGSEMAEALLLHSRSWRFQKLVKTEHSYDPFANAEGLKPRKAAKRAANAAD